MFKYHGGPISFKSGRQPLEAQSTTEAEYIALSLAAREAAALRNLLFEMYLDDGNPTTIYEDNQPAIDLLSKSTGDSRTKHIDLRWHYIR